jgi:alpha-D-ribose 1-methylphosphonate 5-triphosphate synthase subunit PhnI
MFTIEHEFDATVITLVDEGVQELALREDITIEAFEDCVVMRQLDPLTEEEMVITLSLQQLSDLTAALNLPEGSYRIKT